MTTEFLRRQKPPLKTVPHTRRTSAPARLSPGLLSALEDVASACDALHEAPASELPGDGRMHTPSLSERVELLMFRCRWSNSAPYRQLRAATFYVVAVLVTVAAAVLFSH